MEKAYRYRFYPTVEQESILRRTIGCVRLVFNKALAARTEAWYEKQERVDYVQTSAIWGELIRQLEYKAKWYGRTLVKIDRWFPSSKRCGSCGHVVDKLPLNIREWDCPNCGTHHDRDINAAKNILAVGHTVTVCGANIRPDGHKSKGQLQKTRKGRKQKPKS